MSVVRPCGCRVPEDVDLDAMCLHDLQFEEGLRARQIDSHPDPGGHHVFVLPRGRCSCGLVLGSPEYRQMVAPGWLIPLYRRYFEDRQIFPAITPVLIRVWESPSEYIGHVVAPFDLGSFEIPYQHPLRQRFFSPPTMARLLSGIDPPPLVTVETTEVFLWHVEGAQVVTDRPAVRVDCIPWLKGFRKSVRSDAHYLANHPSVTEEERKLLAAQG